MPKMEEGTYLFDRPVPSRGYTQDCFRSKLNIQIHHVQGILLNEFPAGLDLVAH